MYSGLESIDMRGAIGANNKNESLGLQGCKGLRELNTPMLGAVNIDRSGITTLGPLFACGPNSDGVSIVSDSRDLVASCPELRGKVQCRIKYLACPPRDIAF